MLRNKYYTTIKNDEEKYKNYLNKMKVYNKNDYGQTYSWQLKSLLLA